MKQALARTVNRLRDERGIALVVSMGVLLVISVSLTGVIYMTSANARSSSYAKEEHSAVDLAEAGLNDALSVIFHPDNDVNLDDPNWLGSEASPLTITYDGGTVSWYGQLHDCAEDDATGCDLYWLLTATAQVANPTGPGAAAIRRTLTVRVPMTKPSPVDESIDLWNWVYNNQQTGSTCDMMLDQGVAMYVPLYVKGNLCMWSTSKILHNGSSEKPTSLVVGGNLSLKTSQNSVGTAGVPLVGKVRVAGWCQYWNKATVSPCQKEEYRTPPPGNVYIPTNVFASDFSNDLSDSPLTLPPIYWWAGDMPDVQPKVGWYEKASPGPSFPCNADSMTGTPPTFDNNAVMDASVPGIFNLTPPDRSYTCKTRRGELTWSHTARKLTVSGVIFIDGSVEVNNGTGVLTYEPSVEKCTEAPEPGAECNAGAVIYVGGTVNIKGSKLCAVAGSSTCDWDNWQPNMNILVFAAYRKGLGQVNADESIQVENSHFQGALYGKWAVDVTTAQTKTQGPLVSETEVKLGQQAGSWFPPIEINPLGMPGAAPKFPEPQQPDYGTGFGEPSYG